MAKGINFGAGSHRDMSGERHRCQASCLAKWTGLLRESTPRAGKIFAFLVLLGFSFSVQPSRSLADSASVANGAGKEVSFSVAPYVWAASLEGDLGAFGAPTVEVDAGFTDVLSNLEFTAMLAGELRYGAYGISFDVIYLDLKTDAQDTPGPLFGSADVQARTFIGTALGSVRVVEEGSARLDALAGARLWTAKTELSLSGGILDGRSFEDEATWVDPVVGVKGAAPLIAGVSFTGWGLVGGFGAGSEFMWDVFGGVEYRTNDWLSLNAGYRAIGVDYDEDGFVFDAVMHGPIAGAVFRF